jgi:hypothetical protein
MARVNKQKLDVVIRFQFFKGTSEEQVLTYLKNHKLGRVSSLAMQAMLPYWLPLAILENDTTALRTKQQLGRDAVRELLLHINYICSSLGIEPIIYPNTNNGLQASDNKAETNSLKDAPQDKLLLWHLESSIGNGDWGSLGSFDS